MNRRLSSLLIVQLMLLAGCGGGSGASDDGVHAASPCSGSCATSATRLSATDVERVLAQAIAEARARSTNATIAVVDRVGNVLAVYRMGTAANRGVTIASALDGSGRAVVQTGLEGIRLPTAAAPVNLDDMAAIAKAITGAYLSSEGNAFSTRTASQIVQEHFNPSETNQPGGPLFGVQFSQLACSDVVRAFDGVGPNAGPHRSPLGLSADPGGFPLYKDGTVVGGVGAIADGVYSLDKNIADRDVDVDELIAYAAAFGFTAPVDRRADRITADGRTLRFSDGDFDDLITNPANAPALSTVSPSVGALIAVRGYTDGVVRSGTAFGEPASGVRPEGNIDFPGLDAFVLVDAANMPRFAPRAGQDVAAVGASALTRAEVVEILHSAMTVANRTRAQIRRPQGSQARVSVSIVDSLGNVLGLVRSRDAPLFGADVSLQKARTAAAFSSASAASFLGALPNARYLVIDDASASAPQAASLGAYVNASQAFFGAPSAFADGRIAFSARAIGNIARPFYPDGIASAAPGPFSKSTGQWSAFSTGLQLDLSINAITQHVLFVAGAFPTDVGTGCAGVELAPNLSSATRTVSTSHLANGAQIFPGSVPIYRNGVLVGAIGVSGDGVDQDDMIAFLGLHHAAAALNTSIGNAPTGQRSDTLTPQGVRLRFVQCPPAPFLDSSEENVCDGK